MAYRPSNDNVDGGIDWRRRSSSLVVTLPPASNGDSQPAAGTLVPARSWEARSLSAEAPIETRRETYLHARPPPRLTTPAPEHHPYQLMPQDDCALGPASDQHLRCRSSRVRPSPHQRTISPSCAIILRRWWHRRRAWLYGTPVCRATRLSQHCLVLTLR
jgi:hypothetical protein